ncbi:hypothetical protein [Paraburkholderia oxyphila]|uniref:hypothetical protein n=1 Tax=Paraburkholderia oxyphila TaxID=614212 RepID=UPI000482D00B|nr:hypothetical protein [Paraburkholderia oxyphila]
MSLLVWKGSLEKPLLRDVLAGSGADTAWPERAPVKPGVAFFEGAASVGETGAAFLLLVSWSAAGVAFARAVSVSARGAARSCSFASFTSLTSVAAPAAARGLAALARGGLALAA